MAIEPINLSSIGSIKELDILKPLSQNGKKDSVFEDVFKNAWNSAVSTQQDLAEKQYLQSIGEIEDTFTVPIASAKAELSLSMMVNLRNKALEAYTELMRISV